MFEQDIPDHDGSRSKHTYGGAKSLGGNLPNSPDYAK